MTAGKKPGKNPPKKDARGLFVVGNNGGRGRPKGAPDRRTAPFRKKIDAALPDVLETVITAAKNGDIQACKILLDKSLPAIKPAEQPRALPIAGDTLTDKAASIVNATATGAISVDEATRLLSALGSVARILEADQLEQRITALEAKV